MLDPPLRKTDPPIACTWIDHLDLTDVNQLKFCLAGGFLTDKVVQSHSVL